MTKEEKKLLIKDLSARLPHGVICKTSKGNGHLCSINQHIFGIEYGININATERDYFNDKEDIKPYLRSMLSMTKEEYNEVGDLLKAEDPSLNLDEVMATIEIDWLNSHHFDYRGLNMKISLMLALK